MTQTQQMKELRPKVKTPKSSEHQTVIEGIDKDLEKGDGQPGIQSQDCILQGCTRAG